MPGLISPRCSIALMVLRLADKGRISSLSFKRRRIGLPPSESVSSWYPFWMCESRSCSISVSFGRSLAVFFFAISTSIRRKFSSPFPVVGVLGTRFGNRAHTVAKAETTGYARAFRRACDWQQRCRSSSSVGYRALRKRAPETRFRQWPVQCSCRSNWDAPATSILEFASVSFRAG